MPQTPLGLTYPDDQGHTRLWEHFQTLAESVDALFATYEQTVSSPWAYSYPIRYFRIGTVCWVQGELRHTSGLNPSNWTTITSVPTGFKPATESTCSLPTREGTSKFVFLQMLPGTGLQVFTYSSGVNQFWPFTLVYSTADAMP